MTVKGKVGRHRYIVFQIDGSNGSPRMVIERLIHRLRGNIRTISLIEMKKYYGIVHVFHFELESARGAMNTTFENVKIRTIATSGTLRKAREILQGEIERHAHMRN
jgi:RNase P/RNase MRP subunit POP5